MLAMIQWTLRRGFRVSLSCLNTPAVISSASRASHARSPATSALAIHLDYASSMVSSASCTLVDSFFCSTRANVFAINGSSMATFLRCNSM